MRPLQRTWLGVLAALVLASFHVGPARLMQLERPAMIVVGVLAAWSAVDELARRGLAPVDASVLAGAAVCTHGLGGGWGVATLCVVLLRALQVDQDATRSLAVWLAALLAFWLPIALLVPPLEVLYVDIGADIPGPTTLVLNTAAILGSPRAVVVGAGALALREVVDTDGRWHRLAWFAGVAVWLMLLAWALALPLMVLHG